MIETRKRTKGKETQEEPASREEQSGHVPLFTDKRRGKAKQVSKAKQGVGLSKEQLVELERKKEAEVQEWYHEIKAVEVSMRAGNEEAINHWLLYAELLVEMFRETRKLFAARGVSDASILELPTLTHFYHSLEAFPECSGRPDENEQRLATMKPRKKTWYLDWNWS